eukprot:jgi/Ulvmu1/5484/UM023_0020.1
MKSSYETAAGRRKLQWLKEASVSDASAGRDQSPARTGTLKTASLLAATVATGSQLTNAELKAAISNSVRSAVALKLRQAAHETRATHSSQQRKEPVTQRRRASLPAPRRTETDSVGSVWDAVSLDGLVPAEPQYAPKVERDSALSILALDVANSTTEPGQNYTDSAAHAQVRVHAARTKREFRVLQHHAGAEPARLAWERHPSWADPAGTLGALQDAAEAAAAPPRTHQALVSRAEQQFFQPVAEPAAAVARPVAAAAQQLGWDEASQQSGDTYADLELPARRAVRTAVGDCRSPRALLAQKVPAAGRSATAGGRLGGRSPSTRSTQEPRVGRSSAATAAALARERGAAPGPELAVWRLDEEFDLREWRGHGHLITVDAERKLRTEAACLLRRLARDGGALILRDQALTDRHAVVLASTVAARPAAFAAVEILDLSRNALSDAGLAALAPVLHGRALPRLTALVLSRNMLRAPSAARLADALLRTTRGLAGTLRRLCVSDNLLGDEGVAELLNAASENVAQLEVLELRGCGAACAARAAACISLPLLSHLRHLDLSWSTLGSHGSGRAAAMLGALGRGLAENTSIRTLDLSHCSLHDRAAADAIAHALAHNTTLGTLLIAGNGIDGDCALRIAAGLAGNAHLCHLDVSANPIGSVGAAALLRPLLCSPTLDSVNVMHCTLGNGAATAGSVSPSPAAAAMAQASPTASSPKRNNGAGTVQPASSAGQGGPASATRAAVQLFTQVGTPTVGGPQAAARPPSPGEGRAGWRGARVHPSVLPTYPRRVPAAPVDAPLLSADRFALLWGRLDLAAASQGWLLQFAASAAQALCLQPAQCATMVAGLLQHHDGPHVEAVATALLHSTPDCAQLLLRRSEPSLVRLLRRALDAAAVRPATFLVGNATGTFALDLSSHGGRTAAASMLEANRIMRKRLSFCCMLMPGQRGADGILSGILNWRHAPAEAAPNAPGPQRRAAASADQAAVASNAAAQAHGDRWVLRLEEPFTHAALPASGWLLFDHVPLLHYEARSGPRSACHLQGMHVQAYPTPLWHPRTSGTPASARISHEASMSGSTTGNSRGELVELVEASAAGAQQAGQGPAQHAGASDPGDLERAPSIFGWMRTAVRAATPDAPPSAAAAAARLPTAGKLCAVAAAAKRGRACGTRGRSRGGAEAVLRPPTAANSWVVARSTAAPSTPSARVLRHPAGSALASKRWAALLDAARHSGLGHGLLHAVAAHLTHLVPVPPAATAAGVAAAAAAADLDDEHAARDGRGHQRRTALHSASAGSGSKPPTPARSAADAETSTAPGSPSAPLGAPAGSIDALTAAPDPLPVASKGKSAKRGQPCEPLPVLPLASEEAVAEYLTATLLAPAAAALALETVVLHLLDTSSFLSGSCLQRLQAPGACLQPQAARSLKPSTPSALQASSDSGEKLPPGRPASPTGAVHAPVVAADGAVEVPLDAQHAQQAVAVAGVCSYATPMQLQKALEESAGTNRRTMVEVVRRLMGGNVWGDAGGSVLNSSPGVACVWQQGDAEAAVLQSVRPLPRLWETWEVDVPAGGTVATAGQPQDAVYIVLYGHGAVRVPHDGGQNVAYGVSTGDVVGDLAALLWHPEGVPRIDPDAVAPQQEASSSSRDSKPPSKRQKGVPRIPAMPAADIDTAACLPRSAAAGKLPVMPADAVPAPETLCAVTPMRLLCCAAEQVRQLWSHAPALVSAAEDAVSAGGGRHVSMPLLNTRHATATAPPGGAATQSSAASAMHGMLDNAIIPLWKLLPVDLTAAAPVAAPEAAAGAKDGSAAGGKKQAGKGARAGRGACCEEVAGALEVVPPGEPWSPCPVATLAALPQSARAAPQSSGRAAWHKRRAQHAAWRVQAGREILEQLRSHCGRCEVTVQGVQDLLRLTEGQRWPQPLRVAALQACYAALPAAELCTFSAANACLSPSEQLSAAARMGAHRCFDPYRGAGTRCALRMWDACDSAFAARVWKLTEKLAVAAGDCGDAPVRKIAALAVNGRPVRAWPPGLSRLDALRHLDWAAFQDAHAVLTQRVPDEAPAKPPQVAAGGVPAEAAAAAAAAPVGVAPAGAAAAAARVAGAGVRVEGRKRGVATKASDAAACAAARSRIAAVVADARRAAQQMAVARNTVEFELESFTDVEVRQVAAVTLQRGFFRLQQRAALLRTRFAVLRVQSSGLAMLLRRWERRFARFLTAEQARLVAGCQDVIARRGLVRGNAEERRILAEALEAEAVSTADTIAKLVSTRRGAATAAAAVRATNPPEEDIAASGFALSLSSAGGARRQVRGPVDTLMRSAFSQRGATRGEGGAERGGVPEPGEALTSNNGLLQELLQKQARLKALVEADSTEDMLAFFRDHGVAAAAGAAVHDLLVTDGLRRGRIAAASNLAQDLMEKAEEDVKQKQTLQARAREKAVTLAGRRARGTTATAQAVNRKQPAAPLRGRRRRSAAVPSSASSAPAAEADVAVARDGDDALEGAAARDGSARDDGASGALCADDAARFVDHIAATGGVGGNGVEAEGDGKEDEEVLAEVEGEAKRAANVWRRDYRALTARARELVERRRELAWARATLTAQFLTRRSRLAAQVALQRVTLLEAWAADAGLLHE